MSSLQTVASSLSKEEDKKDGDKSISDKKDGDQPISNKTDKNQPMKTQSTTATVQPTEARTDSSPQDTDLCLQQIIFHSPDDECLVFPSASHTLWMSHAYDTLHRLVESGDAASLDAILSKTEQALSLLNTPTGSPSTTLLHDAVTALEAECVSVLLQYGARVDLANHKGKCYVLGSYVYMISYMYLYIYSDNKIGTPCIYITI